MYERENKRKVLLLRWFGNDQVVLSTRSNGGSETLSDVAECNWMGGERYCMVKRVD